MEPRNKLMRKASEQRKKASKRTHFRIVKLEERIAPKPCGGHYNPHGKLVGGNNPHCGGFP